jgi:hypothetical protein
MDDATFGRLDTSISVLSVLIRRSATPEKGEAMDVVRSARVARIGRCRGFMAAVATGCFVAGCSVSAASTSPSAVAGETPMAALGQSSPARPTAGPTSSPAQTAPPAVGTAPAGRWTGIRWISAGAAFPQTPVPDGGNQSSVQISVFGWSRGYVGFRTAITQNFSDAKMSQEKLVMVSTASTDGVHWTSGKAFGEGDQASWVVIRAVVEGPAGLLAVGVNPAGMCGGPATVGAMWTSLDGQTWTRVKPPADFAAARVYTVDAGSTGYIATGTLNDDVTPAVWVSADGRSWGRAALPKPTGGSVVDGATAFAGGYVISGAQHLDIGCGMSEFVPSLWWSSDGKSWTSCDVSGAMPAGDAWVTVNRVSDHALMAIATGWDATGSVNSQQIWVTGDGKSWQLVKSPSSLLSAFILSDGQRGLMAVNAAPGHGPPTLAAVGDDLTVTTLSQSGDGPVDSDTSSPWIAALGPTGIVILSMDGLNLWLGVPTPS